MNKYFNAMNVISTTITKRAEETTANARYRLEYAVEEGALRRCEATVFSLTNGGEQLGYIIFENENIHCSLPGDTQNSTFFDDFELFLSTITEEVTSNK